MKLTFINFLFGGMTDITKDILYYYITTYKSDKI